jgi:hypothetical protein
VHLAYLDDSDSKQKHSKWQVMTGVIIEDVRFKKIEIAMSLIQDSLIPAEKIDKFEEFHACELYGGYGVFEGIEQERRFAAIGQLLNFIKSAELAVVYGAVNLTKLQNEVYASADPLDISFRTCANGINLWANEKISERAMANDPPDRVREIVKGWLEALIILIVDECDKKIKDTLQKSFRSIRPKRKPPNQTGPPTVHFHDDMYFGDSRFSIGIQLADLCSYFIARHLNGDKETEMFYEMIRPYVVFSKVHPPEHSEHERLAEFLAPKEIA